MKLIENKTYKICRSKNYNYIFNKETGFFARWGKKFKDDPELAPSCEILDLEISAGGQCRSGCKFCYKGNGENEPTYNMTFEKFKIIFHKVYNNGFLNQIAFGILDIGTNPDFFKMMKYCREHGVIPNYTCHGLDMTPEYAKKTAELCGAVAVSLVNKEKTYNTIKTLTDLGMNQVNIHFVLAEETYDNAFNIIDDITTDPRLEKFNAIVFLQYKHKNKKSPYHSMLDIEKYRKLINYCEEKKVNYGFDSCSCNNYIESIKDKENRKELEMQGDPCESQIFSFYINCKGIGYPCSFVEGIEEGIDILNCDNFVKDVWNSKISNKWRKKLLENNRNCPIYDLNFAEKKL